MRPSPVDVLQARARGEVDNYRVAVALEGGGMRGVVSGAALIALKDAGLAEHVDVFYGTSSGSINVTYFAANASWDALSVYYDQLPYGFVRRMSVRSSARLDMALLENVMRTRVPLDIDALHRSNIDVRVVVTDMPTISPVVKKMREEPDPIATLIAGSWLPILAGHPKELSGRPSLDGGVLWADPLYAAISEGCTHVLAINTSAAQVSGHSDSLRFVLRGILNRWQPGLGTAYVRSREQWNIDKSNLKIAIPATMDGATVVRWAPETGSHDVQRLTMDRERLLEGVRAGYQLGQRISGAEPAELYFSVSGVRGNYTPQDL